MFKIKNFDELGYEKYYYLINLNLWENILNIILTDDNKVIIESLKNSYILIINAQQLLI